MTKRLLSIFCSLALLLSCIVPSLMMTSFADTSLKGSALGGVSLEADVVTKSGVSFCNKHTFAVKQHFNSATAAQNLYRLNGQKTVVKDDIVLYNNPSYGTNYSMKTVIDNAPTNSVTPPGGEAGNYHVLSFIGTNKFLTTTLSGIKDDAFAFWINTDKEISLFIRAFTDNSSGSEKYIETKLINIPAGESIVYVPLGSMIIGSDTLYASTATNLEIVDIDFYYAISDTTATTATVNFDDMGICTNHFADDISIKGKPLVKNNTYTPEVSSGSDIKFCNKHTLTVKQNFNSATAYNQWRSNFSANSVTRDESVKYNNAAYGTNASMRVTVNNQPSYKKTPPGGTERYYHAMSNTGASKVASFTLSGIENDAFAFWIKTEQPLTLFVRAYTDITSGSEKYLESQSVEIPVGENIIYIPIGSMVVGTDELLATNATEIVFQSVHFYYAMTSAATSTTTNVWFDDMYLCADHFEPATSKGQPLVVGGESEAILRSEDGVKFCKNYTTKFALNGEANISGWNLNPDSFITTTATLSWDETVGYAGPSAAGTGSIKTTVKRGEGYPMTPPTGERSYYSRLRYNGNFGTFAINSLKDYSLSFWVKSDQPLVMFVRMYGNTTVPRYYETKQITVPAGENVITLPLGSFIVATDEAFGENDTSVTFYSPQIFYAPSADATSADATVNFDHFGWCDIHTTELEKVNYKNTPLITTSSAEAFVSSGEKVYFGDDFNVKLHMNYDGSTKIWRANFGQSTLSWDTATNYKDAYYAINGGIKTTINDSPIYGLTAPGSQRAYYHALSHNTTMFNLPIDTLEDYTMAFWVKTEQPIRLFVRLYTDVTSGQNKYCESKVVEIPAGESIVHIPFNSLIIATEEIYAEDATNFKSVTTHFYYTMTDAATSSSTNVWFDHFGFYNRGSGSDNFRLPPDEYTTFEDGFVSKTENFERFTGSDDMDFCTDWYFDTEGWVSLEKSGADKQLRMDFDMTKSTSILYGITPFDSVDPKGGISFWAKTSDDRNYGIKLTIGGKTFTIAFKGSTEGKTYKIPFSAFRTVKDLGIYYEAASSDLTTVTMLQFLTNMTYNELDVVYPATCTLWIDDISFIDSLAFRRAAVVDYYENGVCIRAEADAFNTAVDPVVKSITFTDGEKKTWLSQMNNVDTIASAVSLAAYNLQGIAAIPNRSIEIVFDVPTGVNANQVAVYQYYFDGSVVKTNTTIGTDGKLHASVFRLGDFIVTYNSKGPIAQTPSVDNNDTYTDDVIISIPTIDDNDIETNESVTPIPTPDKDNNVNDNSVGSKNTSSNNNNILFIIVGVVVAVVVLAIIFGIIIKRRRMHREDRN